MSDAMVYSLYVPVEQCLPSPPYLKGLKYERKEDFFITLGQVRLNYISYRVAPQFKGTVGLATFTIT